MNAHATIAATVLVSLALAAPAVGAQERPAGGAPADEELIANATSAAPAAVGRDATVATVGEDGELRTIRKGSGSFTCLPDLPASPGNDPMCLDPNAVEWLKAYLAKKPPQPGKVGFGYMLQGGSDASNTDPYATGPAEGQDWIDTGPHVMIFGATEMVEGYPAQHGDATAPYVMWPGTPYAHLMIPVR